MDHYCPFVLTCIGAANHKSFLLFCLYQSLAIAFGFIAFLQWLYYDSIDFLVSFKIAYRPLVGAALIGDVLVVVSFLIFAGGMGLTHLDYLMKGITTLDDLGYDFENRDKKNLIGRLRSKWDFGVLYNLKCAGFNNWTWFLPIAHREKYEGYVWNEIAKGKELILSKRNMGVKVIRDGEEVELKSIKEVMETSKDIYKGYTVMFFDDGVEIF